MGTGGKADRLGRAWMALAGMVGPRLCEQLKPYGKWGLKDAGTWRAKSSVQKGNVILLL